MSTITKELAKLFRKITNSEIDAEGNAHVVLSPADSLLINNARIALASLEAEPVADVVAWSSPNEERTCDIRWRRFDLAPGPLFAVAQPAPVVPDEREAFNVWNNDTDCPLAGLTVKQAAWLAWLKRSGTIKSFEPATDEFEVWARSEGLIHDSYGLRTVNTSADVARKAWNACRAAMLQAGNHTEQHLDMVDHSGDANKMVAGNSPVIPDGWIKCSERMPEDEQEVLTRNRMGHCFVSFFDEHSGLFFDRVDVAAACCIEHILVTHWMPLPAAPQQDVRLALEIGMSRYAGAMQKLVDSGD
ncbi:TPA: DUF551 domain-containing protein [Citrobacter freundii]